MRQDVDLKRVSIEERKALLAVVKANPELGAKRIAEEFNKDKDESRQITQRMVYDELKRLGLNTKELRIEYLKRHQLYEEDQAAARRSSRDMVEDLLKAPQAEEPSAETPAVEQEPEPEPDFLDELGRFIPDTIDTSISRTDDGVTAPPPREPAFDASSIDSIFDNEEMEVVGDLELNVVRDANDVTILRIDGHLDSVSTTALEQKLNDIIARGALKMVVDLSSVSYISSGGWGIMVGEVKHLREQGGDVVLVGMSAEVYDVYELLGFSDILKALPDIEAACGYFMKPVDERMSAAPAAPVESPLVARVEPLGPASEIEESFAGGGEDAEPSKELQRVETEVTEWDSLRIEAATVGATGNSAVLSLTGIIDTVSAENLRQAIDKVIQNGIYRIVIDMSLVEYVSSGGWGTFTERLRDVRRHDGDIKLFGMDPDVFYIFTMLGFNIVLSSFDVLTDAIEDFDSVAGGKPTDHPQTPADAHVEPAPATFEPTTELEAPPVEKAVEPPVEPPIPEAPVRREINLKPLVSHGNEWARWEESDGVLVGTARGPIEAVAVDRLDGELKDKLQSKPIFLMLDFSNVDYISSTGWGLVAKYNEVVRSWGGSLAICGMNQDLYEIFSLLELHSIISTYLTRGEALTSFGAQGSDPAKPRPQAPAEPSFVEPIDHHNDTTPSPIDDVSVEDILGPIETGTPTEVGPADSVSEWDEEELTGGAMSWADDDEAVETEAVDETVKEDDPTRSLWKSPSFEKADEKEEVDRAQDESDRGPAEVRDDVFVDLSADSHNIDVDSAEFDDHVPEDKKIRDMGWAQYGQKLKKIKKKNGKDKKEDDDAS